jgi:hypothetical protein
MKLIVSDLWDKRLYHMRLFEYSLVVRIYGMLLDDVKGQLWYIDIGRKVVNQISTSKKKHRAGHTLGMETRERVKRLTV